MPFTSVEKTFFVLEYARTQSVKTARRTFAQRVEKSAFRKVSNQKQIWNGVKSLRKKVAFAE